MTGDTVTNDETAEHIRCELSDGPAEQDWLVETLTERYGHGRQDVLGTIRTLMRRGEVSYDLRWRLQYEREDV